MGFEGGDVVAVGGEEVDGGDVGEGFGDGEAGVAGEDIAPVADGVDGFAGVAGGDEDAHGGIIGWEFLVPSCYWLLGGLGMVLMTGKTEWTVVRMRSLRVFGGGTIFQQCTSS
jgi:hypothetical protein